MRASVLSVLIIGILLSTSVSAFCGNGACEGSEDSSSCFIDCGVGQGCTSCGDICEFSDHSGSLGWLPNTSSQGVSVDIPSSVEAEGEFDGYIIVLEDDAVLERKQVLDQEVTVLEREEKELQQDLQAIEQSDDFFLSKIAQKAVKNVQLSAKQQEKENAEGDIADELKDYNEQLKEKIDDTKEQIEQLTDAQTEQEFSATLAGFVADLSEEEAQSIAALEGVKAVYPNLEVEADLDFSVPFMRADQAWTEGFTGKDITIGIIDTGVDYTHEDLGGNGFGNIVDNEFTDISVYSTYPPPFTDIAMDQGRVAYLSLHNIRLYDLNTQTTSNIPVSPVRNIYRVDLEGDHLAYYGKGTYNYLNNSFDVPDTLFHYNINTGVHTPIAETSQFQSVEVDDGNIVYTRQSENLSWGMYYYDTEVGEERIIENYGGGPYTHKASQGKIIFDDGFYLSCGSSFQHNFRIHDTRTNITTSITLPGIKWILGLENNIALFRTCVGADYLLYNLETNQSVILPKPITTNESDSNVSANTVLYTIPQAYMTDEYIAMSNHHNPHRIWLYEYGKNKTIQLTHLVETHTFAAEDSNICFVNTDNQVYCHEYDNSFDYPDIPELQGCIGPSCKVVDGWDFVNNDADPFDDHGHGTHVAATAAGKGVLDGVAPDAKVVAYKVLGSNGRGSFSNIIASIERSVDPNQDGDFSDHLDIISLSLGANCGGSYTTWCGPDDPQSLALDNAMDLGVVAVVSAGNNGPGSSTIGTPGTSRKAITVGALSSPGTGIAGFSSRGPVNFAGGTLTKPDVLAPGSSICAAKAFGSGGSCLDNFHSSKSGTSMAAPHVSGAAALLLEKNPTLTPQEIKLILQQTSIDMGFDANAQGSGRIDAIDALNNVSFVESEGERFYFVSFEDSNCELNLTLSSFEGNHSLFFSPTVYSCPLFENASLFTLAGQTASHIDTGLGNGSYAIKIRGSGSYYLSAQSFCLDDTNPPSIEVANLTPIISGLVLTGATVSDTNGLASCEVCVSSDGTCDSEWTNEGVTQTFSYGENQGLCGMVLNTSLYSSGSYTFNYRVFDIGNNSQEGISQILQIDSSAPVVDLIVDTLVDANEQIDYTVNVSDDTGILSLSLSFEGVFMALDETISIHQGNVTAPSTPGIYPLTVTAVDHTFKITNETVFVRVEEQINWSALSEVTRTPRTVSSPKTARDSTGNLHVVWSDTIDGSANIYYMKMDQHKKILVHERQLTTSSLPSLNPDIALQDQTAHIVWEEYKDGNAEIYYMSLDAQAAASNSIRLTSNSVASREPRIALEQTQFVIFWLEDQSQTQLLSREFDYSAQPLGGAQVIASQVIQFDVAEKNNEVVASYITSGEDAFVYSRPTGSVYVRGEAIDSAIDLGQDVSLLVGLNFGSTQLLRGNTSTLSESALLSTGLTSQIEIAQEDSGEVVIGWVDTVGQLHYTKYSATGEILKLPRPLGSTEPIEDLHLTLGSISFFGVSTENQSNQLQLITDTFDVTPPLISNISSSVSEYGATIRWTTNEPATSRVRYGTIVLNQVVESTELKTTHILSVPGLNPGSSYSYLLESEDLFDNSVRADNGGAFYSLATIPTKNRPALPTTLRGHVLNTNNSPAGGIQVTAFWQDTDDNVLNTTTTTLTQQEAEALNASFLEGYYLFNQGRIRAKAGSLISVEATGDLTTPNPSVLAAPGLGSVEISTPLIIDQAAPEITILSPESVTYTQPLLSLIYSVNEPVSSVTFRLNGQFHSEVSHLQDQEINFTARDGENTILLTAIDLSGLGRSVQLDFTVSDNVSPTVVVQPIGRVGGQVTARANVSDSSNGLAQSCEVCITTDGNCFQNWILATNEFTNGDYFGECSYTFDSSTYTDGNYLLAFQVQDITGNSAQGNDELMTIDNSAPADLFFNVSAISPNSFLIGWTPSDDPEFDSYRIYRSTAFFNDATQAQLVTTISDQQTTVFVDSNTTTPAYYAVSAVDTLGNEDTAMNSVEGVLPDTTPPTISLTSPQNITYGSTTISLLFTTNEPTTCVYSLDGQAPLEATNALVLSADHGVHSLVLTCTDAALNNASQQVDFVIDTQAPSFVSNVQAVRDGNHVSVFWIPVADADLNYYSVYRSGTAFTSIGQASELTTTSLTSFNDTQVSEGQTYYYTVTTTDNVGNEQTAFVLTNVTLADTVSPTLTISSPLASTYINQNISLTYTADESLSSCVYSLNEGQNISTSSGDSFTASEGENTLVLSCFDLSGNLGTQSQTFTVDTLAPAAVTGLNAEAFETPSRIELDWTAVGEAGVSYSIYRSFVAFTDVTQASLLSSTSSTSYTDTSNIVQDISYYYAVTSVDSHGNENLNISVVSALLQDTTAPTITILHPQPTIYASSTVSLSVSSNEPTSFCSYSLNGGAEQALTSTIQGSEGENTLVVLCNDTSGNGGNGSVTFTIDTTPPGEVEGLTVENTNGNVLLQWQASLVQQNGAEDYIIYRSFNSFTNVSQASPIATTSGLNYLDTEVESEQTYYYAVTSRDSVGNENRQATVLNLTTPDFEAPNQISGLQVLPTAGQTILNLTWSASTASDFSHYEIYRSSQSFSSLTSATHIANVSSLLYEDTGLVSEATYYYAVVAVDTSGNRNENVNSVAGIVADVNHPILTITSPQAIEYDTTTISITYTADEPVTDCHYNLDGAGYISLVNEITVGEGEHWLSLQCDDTSSNRGGVGPVYFTVSVPPDAITGLQVNHIAGLNALDLQWDGSGASDFSHYEVYRSSQSFSIISAASPLISTASTSYRDEAVGSGETYHYAVVAVDIDNNSLQDVSSVSATVADTVAPNVSLTSPLNIRYNTPALSLSYSASEAVSCTYRLNGGESLPATAFIVAVEGQNDLTLFCADLANNTAFDSVSFTVDTQPPSAVTGVSVTQLQGLPGLNVSWEAHIDADVIGYNVYRDTENFVDVLGKTPLAFTTLLSYADLPLTQETEYFYAVTAVDEFLQEYTPVVARSETVLDLTPPDVTVLSPLQETYNSPEVSLQISANEPLLECTYSLNYVNDTIFDSNQSIELLANEGSNTLSVSCQDLAGNPTTKEVLFFVDTIAPDAITGLAAIPVVGENKLIVNWDASTDANLKHYNVYKDTVFFNSTEGRTPVASLTIPQLTDTSVVSEGVYMYGVTAVDQSDNERTDVQSVSGQVADTIPPDQIATLTVHRAPGEVEIGLSWNASAATDLAHYLVFRSLQPFSHTDSAEQLAQVNNASYTDEAVLEGSGYYYSVTAVDDSGNYQRSVASVLGFTADATAPTVQTISLGERIAGTVTLSALVQDEGIGLDHRCEVCIKLEGQNCSWTSQDVINSFEVGSSNGSCSLLWDTTQVSAKNVSYAFRVSDLDNNSQEGSFVATTIIDATGLQSFSNELVSGWNLLSVPFNATSQQVESLLSPLTGSYDQVYYFDTTEQRWRSFIPERGLFDQENDLEEIEVGKSYWIRLTQAISLLTSGFEVVEYSTQLTPGWNYIAYPYLGSTPIEEALASLDGQYIKVYSYDASSETWDVYNPTPSPLEPNTLTTMDAGKGYLIYMNDATVWEP